MRKLSKSFYKGKEPLFKTLKKLTDCDKDYKNSKTLFIKICFTHLSHVNYLLSHANYSKRDFISIEFSVTSDINNLIISFTRCYVITQKSLKGLTDITKRYV